MRILIIITVGLTWGSLSAAHYRTVESRSGQFLVRWLEQFRVPPFLREDEKAADIIVLNPELLTVSTERIKEGLLQQLGVSDHWRGKIRFQFGAGKSNPDRFFVESTRFSNGWSYQVTISPKIRREVWLRGCVAVLLLEMANRLAGDQSAEVPVWLIDGITMELRQSALIDLSPSHTDRLLIGGSNPGLGLVVPTQRHQDPLIATRAYLAQNVPVSATELFLPTVEHLQGSKQQVFVLSAHFFFRQLTSLRAGKASLIQFISSLSSHLNWQQAFFPSFNQHFERMLDLEKWWSVALTDLTHLTPISSWPLAKSMAYLQRILTPAALVGQRRDTIAKHTTFSLQEVISQWDYADQKPTLEQVMNRLRVLGIYADQRLSIIILEYQKILSDYIAKRDKAGYEPSRRGQVRLRPDLLIRTAQRKLDRLDTQWKALVPDTTDLPAQANAAR
ncbi:MAG: hypothetical protein M2R45_03303 [Verrucomicrobia subdivision 3 bacterium]|nr:hypothetical protein [Limisphaerales bacterium]MCS1415419.1 hypothetical protein [Limisphaerales bacterium]